MLLNLRVSVCVYVILHYAGYGDCGGYGYGGGSGYGGGQGYGGVHGSYGYGGGISTTSNSNFGTRTTRYVDGNSQDNSFGAQKGEAYEGSVLKDTGVVSGGLEGSLGFGLDKEVGGRDAYATNRDISVSGGSNEGQSGFGSQSGSFQMSGSSEKGEQGGRSGGEGSFQIKFKTDVSGAKSDGLGGLLGIAEGVLKDSGLKSILSGTIQSQSGSSGNVDDANLEGEGRYGGISAGSTTTTIESGGSLEGIASGSSGSKLRESVRTSSGYGSDTGADGLNAQIGGSSPTIIRKEVTVTTQTGTGRRSDDSQGTIPAATDEEIIKSLAGELLSSEYNRETGVNGGFAGIGRGFQGEQSNFENRGTTELRKEIRVTTKHEGSRGSNRHISGDEHSHDISGHSTSSGAGYITDDYDDGNFERTQFVSQGASSEGTRDRSTYRTQGTGNRRSEERYLTERRSQPEGSFAGGISEEGSTGVRKRVIITTSEISGDGGVDGAVNTQRDRLSHDHYKPSTSSNSGYINYEGDDDYDSDESIGYSSPVNRRKITYGREVQSGQGFDADYSGESDEFGEHEHDLTHRRHIACTPRSYHGTKTVGSEFIRGDNYERRISSNGRDVSLTGATGSHGSQGHRTTSGLKHSSSEELGNREATTFRKEVTVTTSEHAGNTARTVTGNGRNTYGLGSQQSFITGTGARLPTDVRYNTRDDKNVEEYGPVVSRKVVTTTVETGPPGLIDDLVIARENQRRRSLTESNIRADGNINGGYKVQLTGPTEYIVEGQRSYKIDDSNPTPFRKEVRTTSSSVGNTRREGSALDYGTKRSLSGSSEGLSASNFAKQTSSSNSEYSIGEDNGRGDFEFDDRDSSTLRQDTAVRSRGVSNTGRRIVEDGSSEGLYATNADNGFLRGSRRSFKDQFEQDTSRQYDNDGENNFRKEVTITTSQVGGGLREYGSGADSGYGRRSQRYLIDDKVDEGNLRNSDRTSSTKFRKEVIVTTSEQGAGHSNPSSLGQLEYSGDVDGRDRQSRYRDVDEFRRERTFASKPEGISEAQQDQGLELSYKFDSAAGQTRKLHGSEVSSVSDFDGSGVSRNFDVDHRGRGHFENSGVDRKSSSEFSVHISGLPRKGLLSGIADAISHAASPESKAISIESKGTVAINKSRAVR